MELFSQITLGDGQLWKVDVFDFDGATTFVNIGDLSIDPATTGMPNELPKHILIPDECC